VSKRKLQTDYQYNYKGFVVWFLLKKLTFFLNDFAVVA